MPLPSYAIVWACIVGAWISNYLIRIGFGAVLPPIMRELGLSYTAAGALATVFFCAYAVMQFPAGVLGDRFGRRRILVLGLLVGAAASLGTGLAASFAALVVARLVTGLGQGCLFSNDRPIIAAVTPPQKTALGQSVSFCGPGLGLTLGFLLGGVLGDLMPWRLVFVLFALPPVVSAILVLSFVPGDHRLRDGAPLRATLREVLTASDLWLLGAGGATIMYVQYVLATWAPLLFIDVGVRDLGRAGSYSSLQGLSAVAGLLLGGLFADRVRSAGLGHKVVVLGSLVGSAVAAALLGLALQTVRTPLAVAVTLLLGSLFAWSGWGPSFALLGEVFAGEAVGTAFGLYNAICVLGAVVGPLLTGWIRDVAGSFAAGCYLAAAVAVAGAVVTFAVRPAFGLRPPGASPTRAGR